MEFRFKKPIKKPQKVKQKVSSIQIVFDFNLLNDNHIFFFKINIISSSLEGSKDYAENPSSVSVFKDYSTYLICF